MVMVVAQPQVHHHVWRDHQVHQYVALRQVALQICVVVLMVLCSVQVHHGSRQVHQERLLKQVMMVLIMVVVCLVADV